MTTSPLPALSATGQALGILSAATLTQLVNEAFRNYHSTLALSRSPLANSPLVTPTLVLDDASPTAEERGRGLRLVLRWAIEQIAPAPLAYPLGRLRPFDDPTWSDPLWWRYNILRHRYLEPLHPDDFVEGGRYTETLMALTGITGSDTFFDERNRGIQEVAERLRQQIIDGAANGELRRLALVEIVRLLDGEEDAARLLGIAATFDDIFPRSLLLEMAAEEQLHAVERALEYLIAHRLLLSGDGGHSLWLSPALRVHLYERQPLAMRQRRHRAAARYYEAQEAPLATAKHWQRAGHHPRAAQILFAAAEALIHELQINELIQALRQFTARDLPGPTWREVQILLSDLYYRSGQPEDALVACRQALKVAEDALNQARIYRRMGKLYVTRNQLHALGYYRQAAERFTPTDPELPDLLKDRGWLHILRRNWTEAETDLTQALAMAPVDDGELRADIFDALASLYRRQQRYDLALEQARNALALRERLGNLPRIASSFNNLGITYRALGEYWHSIHAYEEALTTYRKLGNQEATAGALMNIGSAYYLLGQHHTAITNYQQGLAICEANHLSYAEATVRYNLAEAFAEIGEQQAALDHWRQGYELSQRAGFADEINAFEQLRANTPLLQPIITVEQMTPAGLATPNGLNHDGASHSLLGVDEEETLAIARRLGRISAKQLMDETYISRATATRRLMSLVDKGWLQAQGKGRGAYYTVVTATSPAPTGKSTGSGDAQALAADQVSCVLKQQQQELYTRFAVIALGLATSLEAPSSLVRLVVHFAQLPDLEHYFELRQYLAGALQMEVDVLPKFILGSTPRQEKIDWLWQADQAALAPLGVVSMGIAS